MASSSKHSILPITEPDLAEVGRNLFSSKLALTINRLLYNNWPNEAGQIKQSTSAITASFADPTTEICVKVVDNETGAIIGHLVMMRKNAPSAPNDAKPAEPEKKKEETPTEEESTSNEPALLNPVVLAAVVKGVGELNAEMEGIEHLQLTHIFVSLSHRRRGIGSRLIQIGMDKARELGLPVRVGSEPVAHDFFVRMGFRDTKHVDWDLDKWSPEKYCGFGLFRLSGMTADVQKV